jgi:hypothetical protein
MVCRDAGTYALRCDDVRRVGRSLACITCVVDHDAHVTHGLRNQYLGTPAMATIPTAGKNAHSNVTSCIGSSLGMAGKSVRIPYSYGLPVG